MEINEKVKLINDVLRILKLKLVCRSGGLLIDKKCQKNKEFYDGAYSEIEELNRHLDNIKWIFADIDCAEKYLSIYEKKDYKELKLRFKEILGDLIK